MAWFGRNPQGNIGNEGMGRRRIYGDEGIQFNAAGRLVNTGQPSDRDRSNNMLLWRDGGEAAGEQNFRYRPWNQSVETTAETQPAAPFILRRTDLGPGPSRLSYLNELPYTTGRPTTGLTSSTKTVTTTTMSPDTIVVEEMRVYDEKPCGWWLYLIIGVLMIGIGIANLILCYENNAVCYIWTGIFLIIFAIWCLIHGGDYVEKKWKSWILIVVGYVTTALVLASFYLVLECFCHEVIEITQFATNNFASTELFRFKLATFSPPVTLNNDIFYNVWVCFALNALDIVLLCIGLGVFTTTMYVIDRFYNSHIVISRRVEPFTEPWLFNPYGQCSLGQAMIVVACAVGSSQYGFGTNYYTWFFTYAPVWSGSVPIVVGVLAALALKSCGNGYTNLAWVAVLGELISIMGSIVSIILMTILIVDNITTLQTGGVMLVINDFSRQMIIASSLLEAISDVVNIINIFYSLSIMLRLIAYLCFKSNKIEEKEEKLYVVDDETSDTDKSTTVVEKKVIRQEPQRRIPTTSPDMPMFEPYRFMGTRSSWYN